MAVVIPIFRFLEAKDSYRRSIRFSYRRYSVFTRSNRSTLISRVCYLFLGYVSLQFRWEPVIYETVKI